MILATSLLPITSGPTGLRVTPMAETPMVFEPLGDILLFQEEWTIFTFFHPTDISQLLSIAGELIEEERRVCAAANAKWIKKCMTPYAETKAIVEMLKRGQEVIGAFSRKREKRALDFVGEGLHWAFGVMDSRSAQDLTERINDVEEGEAKTYAFLEQEVTVLKKTYEDLSGPLEKMSSEMDSLRIFLNWTTQEEKKIREEDEVRIMNLEFRIELLERVSRINGNLLEAQGVQQTDMAILDDLMRGNLHPRVLSEEDLRNLTETLSVKNRDNWVISNFLRAHRAATVRVFPTGQGMRVIIKIPMPERTQFRLHAVYAIPIKLNKQWDGFVQVTSKFLAHSEDDQLIGFSQGDLSTCIAVNDDDDMEKRICRRPNQDWVEDKLSCEKKVFRGQENSTSTCKFWATQHSPVLLVRAHAKGRWFFKFDNEQLFTVTCGYFRYNACGVLVKFYLTRVV